MKSSLLFLFVLLFNAPAVYGEGLACAPSVHSCDFYTCKEQEFQCGARGYWLRLGKPICNDFLKSQARFSVSAQKWITNVRWCLQAQLRDVDSRLTCDEARRFAMGTHVGCYVRTGFCALSQADKNRVYWHLRKAVKDPLSWRQAHQIFKICRQERSNVY